MLAWQTSCTRKEVLRKMSLKITTSQIKIKFLFLGFNKRIVLGGLKRNTLKLLVFKKVIFKIKFNLIFLFQLLNLHLWHTAQCTLRTAPAPANDPESEHLHFILHIKHCTLHIMCLYCILQSYHFTLQASKISLSRSQDLRGKIYLDTFI